MPKPHQPRPIPLAAAAAVFAELAFAGAARGDVAFGQIDSFQNGTVLGWREGFPSPNDPTNEDGGPLGPGDRYLQNISSGDGGPGSRQIMFNRQQWSGDYLAAGVDRLSMDLINLGQTDLFVRVALMAPDAFGTTAFVSTDAFHLAAGGAWEGHAFSLAESDLTCTVGTLTWAEAMADVTEVRILSAQIPTHIGDVVLATLGADNIRAVPEPSTASVALAGGVALLARRRRK